MKVGLYFGTFNPIHVGHLIIANHFVDNYDFDQIWFVISPHNPHKEKRSLLADYHRLALVKEAIEDNDRFRASDIEFSLPQPNYTAHTLTHLKEKYPSTQFALLMGEDNLRSLPRWYNYEYLLENYPIFVYPRVLTIQELEKVPEDEAIQHRNITICKEVPVMAISASFIRSQILKGKDVRYMLTEPVLKYIEEMNFYK